MNSQHHLPTSVSAEFAGESVTIAAARALVDDFLEQHSASSDLRERAALAVSELASNAVQAAPESHYIVTAEKIENPREFEIAVTNSSPVTAIPPSEEWGPDDVLAPRGRGLAIVHAISDSVNIEAIDADRVAVHARLRAG